MTKGRSALPLLAVICICNVFGSQIEEVEYLLNTGEQMDYKGATDLILMIGSTGVGKSTLSKFVAHDSSLVAVKVGSSYVFTDNGTISTVTSKSMTLLPNIYKDVESGQVIVDCPGFSDTREPKFEIAASYFVKQVMEYAKRLKVILVENHFSLTEGADRFGLKRLLKHVSELIPNISHFRGSLALIATKVINQGIPDDEETADIMTFIESFANDLRNDISSRAKNETFLKTTEGILKVVDVIYGDGSGTNVALFRKANKPGSPWESTILQKCYRDIRNLIFQRTPWVDNAKQKYKYTLTTDSVVFIKDQLVPSNNKHAITEISKIVSVFTSGVDAKFSSQSLNIEQKIELAQTLKNQFSAVLNSFTAVKDLSFINEKLSNILPIHGSDPKAIRRLVSRAQFFHEVGGFDANVFLTSAKRELSKTEKTLSDVHQFYQFLLALQMKLEEYKPQSVRHASYRQISKDDFKNFIFDSSKFNIDFENKDQILAIPLTDYLINDLNRVLATGLNYKLNIVHNQQTKHLLMEARNLLTSEINAKLGAYPDLDTLTVIAAKSIFIDSSLTLVNTHINIVAPKIEVIGSKEIILIGKDAVPYPGKASDSTGLAVPGGGGHAGYPGSNSGNIVLVALNVVNPAQLWVKSIGGRGGSGQLGGNGHIGAVSSYPSSGPITLGSAQLVENHFRGQGFGVERHGDTIIVSNQKENVLPSPGGDGGAGGLGGRSGHQFIKVKNHASGNIIKLSQIVGQQGEGANGGIGGVGLSQCARKHFGCSNHEMKERCGKWYRRRTCTVGWEYRCYPHNLDNCPVYPNGNTGAKGASLLGAQANYPVPPIAFGQLWHNLNERVGAYQQIGPEYGELHQYAQHAVQRSR